MASFIYLSNYQSRHCLTVQLLNIIFPFDTLLIVRTVLACTQLQDDNILSPCRTQHGDQPAVHSPGYYSPIDGLFVAATIASFVFGSLLTSCILSGVEYNRHS